MRSRIPWVVALGVAVCLLSGGCGADKVKKPDYTVVPDKQLYARIAKLPGVTKVNIEYVDSFDYGQGYVGEVRANATEDPVALLDHTVAILRQGRWDVSMTLEILQPDRTTSTDALGLKSGSAPNLTERYGPQPGDGSPPTTPPTPH